MPNSSEPIRSTATLRRLCFGGTFNPIHHGHLLCARAVAEASGFDRVTLIPSGDPPHKNSPSEAMSIAPAKDRLAMCRLATEGDPFFETSDIELLRSGPSYTIDTARELKRQGWPGVAWLIGGDTIAKLPTWHEPLALLAEIQFVVMGRPNSPLDWSTIPKPYQVLRTGLVVAPLIEISASEIRSRIQDGRSVRYLTPDDVANYIASYGLYR